MRAVPCIALLISVPALAHAHGELPAGRDVFFVDGVFSGGGTSYGLVLADPGDPLADPPVGPRGLWTCEETVQGQIRWYHQVDASRIIAGTFSGIFETTDGGCSWSEREGVLKDQHIPAIAAAPERPGRVYAITASGDVPNGVYVSDDNGGSFRHLALELQNIFLSSIQTSHDGQRVWITGLDASINRSRLWVSSDSGESFTEAPADLSAWPILVLVGRSADATRLYLAGHPPQEPETLLRANAAVSNLESLGKQTGVIRAAAEWEDLLLIQLDGTTLLRRKGEGRFEVIEDGPTRCLVPFAPDGRFWACGQLRDRADFVVSDDGVNWEGAIAHPVIEPRECPAGSPARLECPVAWAATQSYGIGPGAPMPTPEPRGGKGSGGCAQAPFSPSPLVVALLYALRRRRQSKAPSSAQAAHAPAEA